MMAGMRAFFRSVTTGSDGARWVELPGVLASVVPVTPERSVTNSVLYESPERMIAASDELAWVYDEAGVRAWTVWVDASDRDVADALAAAGHVLDASPLAMAMELDGLDDSPPPVELDLVHHLGPAVLGRINDRAYGLSGDAFEAALSGWGDDPDRRLYFARRGGEPVSCMMTHDHAGDCAIELVATLPEARGRGLAGALLHRSLVDAREHGCETTSLQATSAGAPVYERLGYRTLGTLQMWERRDE